MTRPLVFLDIDGVLALPPDWEIPWKRKTTPAGLTYQYGFSENPVRQLNRLLAETGARVVISSSWRVFFSVDQLKDILANEGVKADVIGVTPELSGEKRGIEIQAWLDANSDYAGQPFVILDDDFDMAHLWPHLLQTKWQHGLTRKLAGVAARRLRGNS